jgi:hypothetical protein
VPKYIEQLGSFDNFQFASVLTAEDIDREKLKKYVFGLLTDKAKAQDARDSAIAATDSVREELTEAQAQLSKRGDPDLAKELEKERARADKAEGDLAEITRTRLAEEVAEAKGLTRKQAQYLKGATKEELETSATEFIETNGITVPDPDQENGDEGDEPPARRTPRSTFQNPTDPKVGQGGDDLTDDKIESIVAGFEQNPFR